MLFSRRTGLFRGNVGVVTLHFLPIVPSGADAVWVQYVHELLDEVHKI